MSQPRAKSDAGQASRPTPPLPRPYTCSATPSVLQEGVLTWQLQRQAVAIRKAGKQEKSKMHSSCFPAFLILLGLGFVSRSKLLPYAFRIGGLAQSFSTNDDAALPYDIERVRHMPPDNLADSLCRPPWVSDFEFPIRLHKHFGLAKSSGTGTFSERRLNPQKDADSLTPVCVKVASAMQSIKYFWPKSLSKLRPCPSREAQSKNCPPAMARVRKSLRHFLRLGLLDGKGVDQFGGLVRGCV